MDLMTSLLFILLFGFVVAETNETFYDNSTTIFICNQEACDWRDVPGVVTPIKSQRSCSACWAFSIVVVLEAFQFRYITGEKMSLSEQWIIDNAYKFKQNIGRCSSAPGTVDGGETGAALEVIKKFKLYRTKDYPFKAIDQDHPKTPTAEPVLTGLEFKTIPNTRMTNVEIKQAIIDHGPVSAYMFAPDDMQDFKGPGIYTCSFSDPANHAVGIIGFGEDAGIPYWIIKNSWGRTRGDKGFYKIRMSASNVDDCGIKQRIVWVEYRQEDDSLIGDEDETKPINSTDVIEKYFKICFSMKPIKRCPRGTTATTTETKRIAFTCMLRSIPETWRLYKDTRFENDISHKLEGKKLTFVETVKVHLKCV